MIILIAGGTHTGKTLLAQRLMEKCKYPYLSIDHLKMGLIRSGNCTLTPLSSDEDLTAFLWPIVREMIKTAIENGQNMIVEGCYIPFSWKDDFPTEYLENIKFVCLIFRPSYIESHYKDIIGYADVIEKRIYKVVSMEALHSENERNLDLCRRYGLNYILIEDNYYLNIDAL